MAQGRDDVLYRGTEVLLLRAAARPLDAVPVTWPDPDDSEALRTWFVKTWGDPRLREAVASASPSLALRADRIAADPDAPERQVRSAAAALARYQLRAAGRPTPFGLFAGVAGGRFGDSARVRFGQAHQAAARCDAAWLLAVIERCEACAPLAGRLTVVFSSLALLRAGKWEVPAGPDRQVIRDSPAVRTVRDATQVPVRISALTDRLSSEFPGCGNRAARMVAELVRLGFLMSSLRPPMTTTDALGHVTGELRRAGARHVPEVAGLLEQLETLHRDLSAHNAAGPEHQAELRDNLSAAVTEVSSQGRTPLCLDLRLDADVTLPHPVGEEMAAAASALIRLSPNPGGSPVWEDYHRRFTDRFGTGTLVPLSDVIDPGTGLGYPAGYPASILPLPSGRDEARYAHLAQLITGEPEVTLTDEMVTAMTGSLFDPRFVPAHVEIAARVRAASTADLDAGRYTLHISPGRSAGTLTGRFSVLAAGSGLDEVYRSAPVVHDGARPVQLSTPPLFIRGQNVGRVPAYLPGLLSIGEHPGHERGQLGPDDLAITATLRGLHLIHRETGQVVEPQVFHPLDLEKQLPPLGRFLAHLPRAFVADYLAFDWGPFRQLPHLPAVRYRRSVLSPEQWRLTASVLPPAHSGLAEWRRALTCWRERTGCPAAVQLHNGDQTLRLDLDEPLHALCLRRHLDDDRPAILTRAPGPEDYGWIGGHAHEIALPLTRRGAPAPSDVSGHLVPVTRAGHGQVPLGARSAWLSAKLFTAPDAMDEIIGRHLPSLIASLGTEDVWFIRYRNREETDHLRLRVAASGGLARHRAARLADWAHDLRTRHLCGWLALDTYYPEAGRYGDGESLRAAEAVFTADSAVATIQLRQPTGIDPVALTALGMLDIAAAFTGSADRGAQWLAGRPLPPGKGAERAAARTATTLARNGELSSFGTLPGDLAPVWRRRSETLAAYRETLDPDANTAHILESLLHIHHNRYLGIDRDREGTCRRLARQAALAQRAARLPESA
ncbi:MAG: lantibiotic dehydratase [Nocardiopsaceae bacterium]|nr:lantibiotic dehydratase [Nocardiopsaceae bacterium]